MSPVRPAPVPVPRPLVALSGIVVVAAVGMTFVGAWRTGIAWDETYHVERMQNFLDHDWFLLTNQLDGNHPGAWEDQEYVYGPLAMTLLHWWAVLWGADSSGTVSASAHAYAVRHEGVAIIAMIGLASAAAIGRIVLRSWRWGLVTAAVLCAIPMWTGHAMVNIKDIPVASGFTLATLGLVLVGREAAGPRLHRLAGPLTIGGGIILAIGTRPGMWAGLLASVVALVALVTLRDGQGLRATVRAVGWRYAELLGGIVLGIAGLWASYPSAYAHPWELLVGSVESSSHYNDDMSPWWYVPVVSLSEFPWLILGLAGFGTVVLLRTAWRDRLRVDAATTALALVATQAFTLPLVAMVRESNLYNGLRQLLFMAPAMAVLTAFGISVLLTRDWGTRQLARRAVPVAACVAVVWPVVDQALLFPYNYAYAALGADLAADAAGGLSGAHDDLEEGIPTDYWRTSVRALAPSIPKNGFVVCSANQIGENTMAFSHQDHQDCSTDPIGPLMPYNDLRSGTWDASPTRFLAVLTGGNLPGPNCTILHEVTRWRHFQTRVMSLVAACDLVAAPLPHQPMTYGTDGTGDQGQLGGWMQEGGPGVGVRPGVPEARLGYALPDGLRGTPLLIRFESTLAPEIEVNGVPRPVTEVAPGQFEVHVSEAVAMAYGEGRLLVRFSPSKLRLMSIAVTAAP